MRHCCVAEKSFVQLYITRRSYLLFAEYCLLTPRHNTIVKLNDRQTSPIKALYAGGLTLLHCKANPHRCLSEFISNRLSKYRVFEKSEGSVFMILSETHYIHFCNRCFIVGDNFSGIDNNRCISTKFLTTDLFINIFLRYIIIRR